MRALEYALGQQAGDTNAKRKARAVRFRSQRSRYLRIILDAEKEIARLEGLYEGSALEGAGEVTFRVVKSVEES